MKRECKKCGEEYRPSLELRFYDHGSFWLCGTCEKEALTAPAFTKEEYEFTRDAIEERSLYVHPNGWIKQRKFCKRILTKLRALAGEE